jgi:peptide/nickel transport system permease protein
MNSGAAELELDAEIPDTHVHPAWATLKRLFRHRLFLSGLGLFGIILLAAALAPWIAPVDPTKLAMRFKFRPPGSDFAFGTDNFGRSLWSRVIWVRSFPSSSGFRWSP